MKEVAVVIPYYHSQLNELEKIAFQQGLKILKKYPIILLVPDSLEETSYPDVSGVLYEKVPETWMKSVATYNQMMLSVDFYLRFIDYKYILIYQLDAFVFEDRLLEFCNTDYDYIGAPWLHGGIYYKNIERCVWFVGNGGFSLRKVNTFLQVLQKEDIIDNLVQEDLFWASCQGDDFKVAPIDIALQFSFEMNVEKCYERNQRRLPFGCHAWEKHNISFWRYFIEQRGYKIPIGIEGNLDQKLVGIDKRYLCLERNVQKKVLKKTLKNLNVPIYIWGTGCYGCECGWLLNRCDYFLQKYIDSNVDKCGNTIRNVEIESFEYIKGKMDSVFLIIAIKDCPKEIINQVVSQGGVYGNNYIFYRDIIAELSKEV